MSRFATVLLVFAAASAALFLVFFEPLFRAVHSAPSAGANVLDLDPRKIRIIRIETGADHVELTLTPDGWIVGPEPIDRADPERVAALLSRALGVVALDSIPAA